jgi:hypothetical protein
MADIPMNIDGAMGSIAKLQSTCNTLERGLKAKLKSLTAGQDPQGRKVTEAIFEEVDKRKELGKAVITESPTGGDSAVILTQPVRVKITRS